MVLRLRGVQGVYYTVVMFRVHQVYASDCELPLVSPVPATLLPVSAVTVPLASQLLLSPIHRLNATAAGTGFGATSSVLSHRSDGVVSMESVW